jgi:hypothetical protein
LVLDVAKPGQNARKDLAASFHQRKTRVFRTVCCFSPNILLVIKETKGATRAIHSRYRRNLIDRRKVTPTNHLQ